ncbi:MAG: nucleotide exchange factor GrpE [Candidatus Paceibacterota bacterium]|jgi:molecular chaperone GrpE
MDKNTQNEEEIIYEDESKSKKTISEDDSDAVENVVKKLKEKIKILESEKTEYMDGWQRERADFVNYKKRVETEKFETIKFANENLIAELLTVIESFEMAFSNKEAWEKVDKNWRVGVEYIHSQFIKILAENGLKEMNPIGEKFNPAFHVAEGHTETKEEKEDGVIVEVKKKGFMLNDRVIVASSVVVAEFVK